MLLTYFLAYMCTLMGLLAYVIHKHSCMSKHISVLTTCTFMFRQVCTIKPSFFKTTSGMRRRLFEGQHLVTFNIRSKIYSLDATCFY